jgi:hypothetical protein
MHRQRAITHSSLCVCALVIERSQQRGPLRRPGDAERTLPSEVFINTWIAHRRAILCNMYKYVFYIMTPRHEVTWINCHPSFRKSPWSCHGSQHKALPNTPFKSSGHFVARNVWVNTSNLHSAGYVLHIGSLLRYIFKPEDGGSQK